VIEPSLIILLPCSRVARSIPLCPAHASRVRSLFALLTRRAFEPLHGQDGRMHSDGRVGEGSSSSNKKGGGAPRYVPLTLRKRDEHRELWHESRVKSRFVGGGVPMREGGVAYERVRPAHAFVLHVPHLGNRTTPEEHATLGPIAKAHTTREHVTVLFTLSQLDTRRAAMAPGYVDAGTAPPMGPPDAPPMGPPDTAPPLPNATPSPPPHDAGLVLYRIAGAAGQPLPGGGVEEVAYVKSNACKSLALEAHVGEGTYVLLPVTGGVRPIPPVTDDEIIGQDPYVPASHLLPLSRAVHDAVHALCFLHDLDLDGRLGRADLSSPTAATFVEMVRIDMAAERGAKLQPGKLIKLADFEPCALRRTPDLT
jgi:hypothetical protein